MRLFRPSRLLIAAGILYVSSCTGFMFANAIRNKRYLGKNAYTSLEDAKHDLEAEKPKIGLEDKNIEVFLDKYEGSFCRSDRKGNFEIHLQEGKANRITLMHELFHISRYEDGDIGLPFSLFWPPDWIEEWQAGSYGLGE